MTTLKEQFTDLIDKHPEFTHVYEGILELIERESTLREIRVRDLFNVILTNDEELADAMYWMLRNPMFQGVYRILDSQGIPIGEDLNSPFDVPDHVEDVMGNYIPLEDIIPEPFILIKDA